MKNVLGLIIAFDTDNDLRELTDHRTVAAVPVICAAVLVACSVAVVAVLAPLVASAIW